MSKLPPFLAGIIRVLLIMLGSTAVLSGVVNIMATIRLVEPSDEAALGLSRNSLLLQFSLQLLVGLVMLFFGFKRRKPGPR